MRYAILSDIHGNIQALQAVPARIAALDADTVAVSVISPGTMRTRTNVFFRAVTLNVES